MSAPRHLATVPKFSYVVLVASLGGMDAFSKVLSGLPASFPVPVLVVQHRAQTSVGDPLVAVLARRTELPVHVAEDATPAAQPGVTVVPGATIATIDADGRWLLEPATRGVGTGDALLMSAAEAGPTIAVILTGYQGDGSRGCRAVKLRGGRVLVQDPSDARAPDMPANAIATGCADFVLPLQRIPSALLALATAPGAADLLTVPIPPWARLSS
ncbi:chemotaxis protein CheB [Mycobacterium angelicum]|uniref:protein-glutamate methylesterase n=1 Tax=Mycobacterium angelicum TaxID=470074 RepID=A0A1X0A2C6_MYCAN|nr:chemotaxis protein CheB [Mycobacterium angelicum]MCV7197355.1 chemotaxis protein CheB [Mycobacterium angelicum]ORA24221.1 chemotaxis protein CheB [Mycobacterium angelicum]